MIKKKNNGKRKCEDKLRQNDSPRISRQIGFIEKKIEAIKAYGTQFHSQNPAGNTESKEPETYISTPDFLDSVVYRHKWFGKMIGVKYAEGFITQKMIGFNNFDAIIKNDT